MAKKSSSSSSSGKKFTFTDIGNLMEDMTKSIPFSIADEQEDLKQEFISTGIYVLNAALSGSLFGGIQSNRITALAGMSGSGKSFLTLGCAREAQKQGYSVIYLDTEFAIQLKELPIYGIDISPELFKLVRINVIEDIIKFFSGLINQIKEVKASGGETPKIMFIVDSTSQLSSRKEIADSIDPKATSLDMTKSKQLTAFFRIINNDLGQLNIPMICTAHTYQEIGLFPKEIMKGGNGLRYAASVIGFLSRTKLKTGEEDDMDVGQSGITVTFKADKNRLAKPKKVKFDISFVSGCNPYKGLQAFCRPEFFDTVGIAKGKWEEYKVPVEVTDDETGEVKTLTGEFKPGGTRYYVKHLNKSVFESQLFNSDVFTYDVLKAMDVHVKDYFRYKSLDEIEDSQKEFDKEQENEGDISNISDYDIFG